MGDKTAEAPVSETAVEEEVKTLYEGNAFDTCTNCKDWMCHFCKTYGYLLIIWLVAAVAGAVLGWVVADNVFIPQEPNCTLETMGAWQEWSKCDPGCGSNSTRHRERKVSCALSTSTNQSFFAPKQDQKCFERPCCDEFGYGKNANTIQGLPYCYQIVTEAADYNSAYVNISRLAVPAQIQNEQQQQAVVKWIKDKKSNSDWWIGLRCYGGSCRWWSGAMLQNYANFNGDDIEDKCIAMDMKNNRWKPMPCSKPLPYVLVSPALGDDWAPKCDTGKWSNWSKCDCTTTTKTKKRTRKVTYKSGPTNVIQCPQEQQVVPCPFC